MAHMRLSAFIAIIIKLFCVSAQERSPAAGVRDSCYTEYGLPQRCIPEFGNAAFGVLMEVNSTCGESGDITYCIQSGFQTRSSCEKCSAGQYQAYFLTDLHHQTENQTWWQSETMNEGVQYPNSVYLTLDLGKAYDITYVRIVFYSPRPESFAIYKRTRKTEDWVPYQYYSGSCRDTYGLPDSKSAERGSETRALCTSEYSDLSPLRGGNVPFSTLEGRPSAFDFANSPELQEWVTATEIRITLDRLNTFGDELFSDQQVLQSYWYAIADVAVGARCTCNGHAVKCELGINEIGIRQRMCQCEHYTSGPDCEKCLDFYNDAPWGRANQTHVHECKVCNCNGYSNRCFFDKELYKHTGHGGHCLDCRDNRDGPNCERCKENYHQLNDNICTPCNCNATGSRSLQCNSIGKCQCKPGVTGDKCDRCSANYFDFTMNGCKACGCSEAGSYGNVPDCDADKGTCRCKKHVEGMRCRECKPGYFNLDLENEYGCTPCFCYGHSSECKSAPGYSKITVESSFARNTEKWMTHDDRRNPVTPLYNNASQNIALSSQNHNMGLYFIAPDRYLGDQRASYNHDLKFTLSVGENAAHLRTPDVILEGAGTHVSIPIFGQNNPQPTTQPSEYTFRLHEHPHYEWNPKLSARAFMSILSNLTAIKIRGTYCNPCFGFLDNVRLETAYRGAAGNPALWIEMCSCPAGYVGQFCESCAPGYRHNPPLGGSFKPCVPCDCNGHADICEAETGRCICKGNTAGDNCELCARGFYGNALNGTGSDCAQCPCPNKGACIEIADQIICTECPAGYAGSKCDLCSDGYYGDPSGAFGPVRVCKACDCNLNIDLNAVTNCNTTTGECLKCIYNSAGPHCDQCLPGYYGDALAPKKGDCQPCTCYNLGTLDSETGGPKCDPLAGQCACRPNVQGRNCDECKEGYFNIVTGEGCESCKCDAEGSYNHTCNLQTGQCRCRPGITGQRCDMCEPNQYGFSMLGCKECMCDPIGSKGLQCDPSGQCTCYDNVEGRQCDRCKENKHDRQRGCVDCPACYNLVQDAVTIHREKLHQLEQMLQDIVKNPTVISNTDFDIELESVKQQIDDLGNQAKNGAGDQDGKSLVERLAELNKRLEHIGELLNKVAKSGEHIILFAKDGTANITSAKEIIDTSRKELYSALDYLNVDGSAALAKAQNRSDQFGQQSTQMSLIAQDSRRITDNLEKEAKNIRDIAQSALNTSLEAYKKAKDGLGQQKNTSNDLRTLDEDFSTAESKLNSTKAMATQSLNRSRDSYNDALDIYAQVNATTIPKINSKGIGSDANDLKNEAKKNQDKLDKIKADNKQMLEDLEAQIKLSEGLLSSGYEQQADIDSLLGKLDTIHNSAEQAVKQGNTTLEDALRIYETLKDFRDQVITSRKEAEKALNTIPQINDLIKTAKNQTATVKKNLGTARENAKKAMDTAKEAHNKYALQASKEAHVIRENAATTKTEAETLHKEAEQLSGRVAETERQIGIHETRTNDDTDLTKDAKTKVGQAKTDATEAEKLVQKAVNEVNTILDELQRLPVLDDKSLATLERHLGEAELELKRANLTARIHSLQETRNSHQKWLKDYEKEAAKLQLDVDNVKDINAALPTGCFKKLKLEP